MDEPIELNEYASKLNKLNDYVRGLDGKIVVDPQTGKGLVKWRDETLITLEMRDPDYALKELKKLNAGRYSLTCSKCHHCR